MFMELMAGQVEAGNRFTISKAKYPHLLSMDLPRGRFKPVNRRRHHTPAYVPDLLTMGKTEVKVSTVGRIAMVSPTSCVFVAFLDNSPRCSTLCQVSCSTYLTPLFVLTQHSFFNVERNQIRPVTAVEIHYTEAGGITGHIMLLCMLLMFTTAHARIRQQSYETFWYTHHLFIPFLLGLYTHATGCFVRSSPLPISPFAGKAFWDHCLGYQGWRWELWACALYLCERVYREIRSRRSTAILKVIRHPYDAVEIQFRKPSMHYKAGQWLFINVPCVSTTQWHPFTITSCPFDPYISIHVRKVGDFTRALGDALGAGPSQAKDYDALDPEGMYEIALANGQTMPPIRIDGPYGAPAEDVFENEIAVLIGTGIGVTPFASILKNIWHLRAGPNPPRRLRRVEFIWVCKDTSSFRWFQTLLASLEDQSLAAAAAHPGAGPDFLRIHTYLTQRLDVDQTTNIYLNSVGSTLDPLTELQSRTNFGRPDFRKLFTALKDGVLSGTYIGGLEKEMKTHVGVYFCGPNAAARDIRGACREVTGPDVSFRFWKEHF